MGYNLQSIIKRIIAHSARCRHAKEERVWRVLTAYHDDVGWLYQTPDRETLRNVLDADTAGESEETLT